MKKCEAYIESWRKGTPRIQ